MCPHTHPFTDREAHGFPMRGGPGGERHHRRGGRRRGGPWAYSGPRGHRARRGDVRTALLVLLAEEPRNGYQLMQEIEQRSGGTWRPSPGSVYPTLQQLEDEGLVSIETRDEHRVYAITDDGRAHVAARGEDAPAPWDAISAGGGQGRELIKLIREVGFAGAQILEAGDDAQAVQAQEVLRTARRSLYRILAEDPEPSAATD